MTGYEPRFSCIRSNEGVNCATTTNLFSNHHMRVRVIVHWSPNNFDDSQFLLDPNKFHHINNPYNNYYWFMIGACDLHSYLLAQNPKYRPIWSLCSPFDCIEDHRDYCIYFWTKVLCFTWAVVCQLL